MKLLTGTGITLLLAGLTAVTWTYVLNPSDFYGNLSSPVILLMVFGTATLSIISFRLSGRLPQRAHVRVITVVFLVIALSVLVTLLYASQTSQIGCLGPCGAYFPTVTITGTIVVQSGSDNGTMTVRLNNSGVNNTSITSISFSNAGLNNDTTIPNIGSLVLMYLGNPVGPANPLPRGETATGSMTVANVTVGTTYDSYANVTYQTGSMDGQQFFFPAQS